MSESNFSSLKLSAELLKNVKDLGYSEMTPIQAQSLPHILNGKDVIGQAKTGSGKTAAFGLGLLQNLNGDSYRVQSLVLCPTRELADQVSKAIRQLARTLKNIKVLTICGGMPFRPQASSLEHGAHIVVGTPGRVAKHLRKGNLKLGSLTSLVLDEGDRMLEMGFQEQIDEIIAKAPKRRQTLLFSATFPDRIKAIADDVMTNPEMVKVDETHDNGSIEQHFYQVNDWDQRMVAIRLLLLKNHPESTVIFCNTKKDAMDVTDELMENGFSALDLHGDLEQRDRDDTLVRFSNKSISVLVATDVAARGLDIDSLDMVINYHISPNPEVHVHRIGRTGRAGSTGIACSLYGNRENHKMELLSEYINAPIENEDLPQNYVLDETPMKPLMASIKIPIGKKQKLRPGNILGALTGEKGLSAEFVGKIHIFDNFSYVAVSCEKVKDALQQFSRESWKGRPIKAWLVGK